MTANDMRLTDYFGAESIWHTESAIPEKLASLNLKTCGPLSRGAGNLIPDLTPFNGLSVEPCPVIIHDG